MFPYCKENISQNQNRLPGSSVHGILQARTLEWVAIFFSKNQSQDVFNTKTLKTFLTKSDTTRGLIAPLLLDIALELPDSAIRKGWDLNM